MGKRLLIGVIAVEPHLERTAEVLRGIITQAFQTDCDIAVLSSVYHLGQTVNAYRMQEQSIFGLVRSGRFDGFLYDSRFLYNPALRAQIDKLLQGTGKPVMTIDAGDVHPCFENTAADDCRPFQRLTEHLIEEHGFQRIYCLTGPASFPDAVQRLAGYFEAMEKHSLHYDRSYYRYGDFWTDSAREMAADILAGKLARPEAVVCGNDICAKALIEALTVGGMKVPEDIAVVGFDCKTQDFGADSRITSYRRANFQLGVDAFRRLYRTITGRIPALVRDRSEGLRIGITCGCRGFTQETGRERRARKMQALLARGFEQEDTVLYLMEKSSFPEALREITGKAYYFYRMRHFAVCLTDAFVQYMRDGSVPLRTLAAEDTMHLAAQRHCTGALDMTDSTFPAQEILPFFGDETRPPCAYYIVPLHSEDTCFGYAALSFGKRPCAYDETFIHFKNAADTLLTMYTRRQAGVHAMHSFQTNPVTGFPTLYSVMGTHSTVSERYLLYLEITDFKLLYCQLSQEELHGRLRQFSAALRRELQEGDLCCSITQGSFAVLTSRAALAEELFGALKRSSGQHRLVFSIGIAENTQAATLDVLLQQAMLRVQYTYAPLKRKESNDLFERLCALQADIRSHPEQEWRIDDMAERLHISRGHLQKAYKQFFGTGITETVIELRIELAKRYLKGSDKSVTEIAELCGYKSYVYFTKQFKKSVGMTPSEYRSKYR